MKKLFLLALMCGISSATFAACPLADAQMKARHPMKAKISYELCAHSLNDAESQFILGQMYLKGNDWIKPNLQTALQYFWQSAENGYAPGQRELAKLMEAMADLGPVGKDALVDEMIDFYSQNETPLPDSPMSAMGWMYLAADKADNKWFYNAPAVMDAEAASLVQKWENQQKPEQVDTARAAAIAWKQQRLMKTARSLLSDKAYAEFESVIYPTKGVKSPMTKAQALDKLKLIKERQK